MNKIIGIDVGYGYTKVVTDGNGIVVPVSFPSLVGIYEDGIEVDGLKVPEQDIVSLSGQRFIVGAAALRHSSRLLNGREQGWVSSAAYRALFLHALRLVEANAVKFTIVSGLPVNFYKSDKDKLLNIIRSTACDFCIDCTVKAIPQPLGSFFSLLFDDHGRVKDGSLASGKVGILDIGFYTTDLITIHDMELIEKQMDSYENGVSTALELIAKDINNVYGRKPILNETEQAIKEGYIRVYGEPKDIRHVADQRLTELSREIESKAKTVWKSAVDIDRVILTGGGAALLKPYLNLYRHASVIDDAQFANAAGYYKLGKRLSL